MNHKTKKQSFGIHLFECFPDTKPSSVIYLKNTNQNSTKENYYLTVLIA